ncbi:hypothetical protein KCP69_24765 [Salmonella enterica subsp. enterica]|nr:hypothetical protein KCP69_24765 [Salmonella enterica subsp. enterica]
MKPARCADLFHHLYARMWRVEERLAKGENDRACNAAAYKRTSAMLSESTIPRTGSICR